MTYDELVAEVTARHPLKPGQMFGMPCLKRENGKVVAGLWKDGGLTVKLTDEAARERALALPGAVPFDPGMGRAMREWVLVPAEQADRWPELVDQALAQMPGEFRAVWFPHDYDADRPWGHRQLSLVDPDGVRVTLFSPV